MNRTLDRSSFRYYKKNTNIDVNNREFSRNKNLFFSLDVYDSDKML